MTLVAFSTCHPGTRASEHPGPSLLLLSPGSRLSRGALGRDDNLFTRAEEA
jgi:hypothetical protein